MALHDLTPQLRTRLGRLERAVGLFVGLAMLLLLAGLVFYVYEVSKRKGWFLQKLPYYTYVRSGAGLKVGQPVRLMGFDVGEITEITAMPPDFYYNNVFLGFAVREPFHGYLWDDSVARVASGDFLGNRFVEVTKGTNGTPTYLFYQARDEAPATLPSLTGNTNLALGQRIWDADHSNVVAALHAKLTPALAAVLSRSGVESVTLIDYGLPSRLPTRIWNDQEGRYRPYRRKEAAESKGYFLSPAEAPAVADRIESVMKTVETAMPAILDLTNHLKSALNEAGRAANRAEALLAQLQPVVTNLAVISTQLTNREGALGEWLIPTNLNAQLALTLLAAHTAITNASVLLTNTDTRLEDLSVAILANLENLAGITSNLHAQVNANTNLLSNTDRLIIDADTMVQGLKKHWLLRSAFKPAKTNAPPPRVNKPPKQPRF